MRRDYRDAILGKTNDPADPSLPAPVTAAIGRRAAWWAGFALIVAFHLWALACYFPPSEWLTNEPFYTNSYAFHFALGEREAAALRRHGRLWSYSPGLMAGYPAATRTEPVGAAVGPWLVLTGPLLPPAIAYKALVLILLGAPPLAMAVAAVWLELPAEAIVLAALMATFATFSGSGLTMIHAGMFAFLSISYLAVLVGAWMYRCVRRGRTWRFVALAIGGGAITYLHSLSPLLFAGPALAAFAASANRRRMLALLAASAGAFVIALGWFLPILATLRISVPFANWWNSPGTFGAVVDEMISLTLNPPPAVILALAAYGAIVVTRWPALYRSVTLASVFALAALTYFGSRMPGLSDFEPARFAISFYFLAIPLAAGAGAAIWRQIDSMRRGRWRGVCQGGALAVLIIFGLIPLRLVVGDLRVHPSIAAKLPPQARELRDWIEAAPAGSRVIVESGWTMSDGQLILPYFGADLGMTWAVESGRELIGGSPSEGFSTYSLTTFDSRNAFRRRLQDWTAIELRAQLDTYNVGAALVWSDEAKRLLAAMPGVSLAHRDGKFEMYTVANPAGPLAAGRADSVLASEDCIVIRAAQPGILVLRYHYFRTLRSEPPLAVSSTPVGNDDRIGFIAIKNDVPRDIVIYNAGFTGLDSPRCVNLTR